MAVIDHQEGRRIAARWLEAFNGHRADAVVEHFADDVTATSPVIATLRPDSGGTLHGKAEVLAYYQDGLRLIPDLHFTLVEVLCGVDQVTILYRNQRATTVAETLTLRNGLVGDVHVTYGQAPPA